MCKSEKSKIHTTSQYRKKIKIHTNHSKVETKFFGQLENKHAQIQLAILRETTEEQNFSHSGKSSNGGIVTGLKSEKNRKARLAYHTMVQLLGEEACISHSS